VNWLHAHLPFTRNLSSGEVLHYLEIAFGGASSMFQSVTHGVVAVLTVLLLAAYFILDGPQSFAWFVWVFPPSQQPRLREALLHGGHRMRRWLGGQALLMLAQGLSGLLAFWLIHVRYFYVLAILAGLFNIIPVLGPILTVIVAGLVAAIDSYTKLLGVVIFYVLYHNIENAFLNPRIMEARVHIPAVGIIAALVIGDALAGIVGILIAVPTAALLSVLIDEYVVRGRMVELAPGEAEQAA
jgi:predicted PurR-regulated permease PerM